MLSRAGLLTLGAFGLGAASGTAATRVTDEPAAKSSAARRRTRKLTLYASEVRFSAASAQHGKLPVKGEVIAPSGKLRDRRDREIGAFHAAALPGSSDRLDFHRFDLADGTILGMGSGGLSDGAFAIVGGTGRFAGATGSYVSRPGTRRTARAETEFILTLTA